MQKGKIITSAYIFYGLGEGPAVSNVFWRSLASAGITIAPAPNEADILIAHSGGYFEFNENTTHQSIILIAPSCGMARRSLLATQYEKVFIDAKYHFKIHKKLAWTYKSALNSVYLLTQPRKLIQLWQKAKLHPNLPILNAKSVTIVTYRNDPWSGFISPHDRTKHPSYRFIELTGLHDDLWINPDPYIALIKNSLAQ